MGVLGNGDFKYEPVANWPEMPRYWSFDTAVGIAVNAQDEIHVLSLGKHPLTIWDITGKFISSWGEGSFSTNPHSLHIEPSGDVWVVDREYHIVSQHTSSGKVVRVLGNKLSPSPTVFGKPFNQPSGLYTTFSEDIFVSDGYGNYRVHRFSSSGHLVRSWGNPGDGPGEFALLHNVTVDSRNRVFICDRMNHRIQLFDYDGAYLEEWCDFNEPCEVWIRNEIAYVIEQGNGSAISIWTLDHELITSWKGACGPGEGTLTAGHSICVDSEGSIYVADVRGPASIRKFQRI